jgi:uncharacterized membrane protein YtjA (UPF0391 family)
MGPPGHICNLLRPARTTSTGSPKYKPFALFFRLEAQLGTGWALSRLTSTTTNSNRIPIMIGLAIGLIVLALIAAVLGFTGLAGALAGLAKIIFVLFLIIAVVLFLL